MRVFSEISSVLGITNRTYCTFVVVKKDGEYYFFGNNILYCLGYDAKRDFDRIVPKNEWYDLGPTISNVYIKEGTVRRLAQQQPNFLEWFNKFIDNCNGTNPNSYYCP